MDWLRRTHFALLDTPWFPLWIATVVFVLVFLRYLLFAGPAYFLCWKWLRKRLHFRRIQLKFPKPGRVRKEFLWSVSTFVIFGVMGCIVFACARRGWTVQYERISDYGWVYYVFSLILMVVVHDAYFYWTHRAMHHKSLFWLFHRVHHVSHNPSPWAAFSFHPLEAFVQSGITLVLTLVVPHHPSALGIFLLFMTLMNVLGHLGYELYPKGFASHPVGRWITTSTHHNMHHHQGKGNYGIYFNWWDRWCGTLHPDYEETYKEVTLRSRDLQSEAPT